MPKKSKEKQTESTLVIIIVIAIIMFCVIAAAVGLVAFGAFGFLTNSRLTSSQIPTPVSVGNQSEGEPPALTQVPPRADAPWTRLLEKEFQDYVIDGRVSTIAENSAPTKGDPAARVTMYEFMDFECPFCRKHALQVQPELDRIYGQTGKLRSVFKHTIAVPSHNPAAQKEAFASDCANRQGKFFEFAQKVFEGTGASGQGHQRKKGSDESMIGVARSLGLNTDSFTLCLQQAPGKEVLTQDTQLAQSLMAGAGLVPREMGTPLFWICHTTDCREGTLVLGALPVSVFIQIIDYYVQNQPRN